MQPDGKLKILLLCVQATDTLGRHDCRISTYHRSFVMTSFSPIALLAGLMLSGAAMASDDCHSPMAN